MRLSRPITRGATSQLIEVRFSDLSQLNGIGKTGLTTASFTSVYYHRGLAASTVAVTLDGTMTLGTWKASGFVEVDSTHLPGLYQIGLPDLMVGTADTSSYVTLVFVPTTASGAPQVEIVIPLVAFDLQTATQSVSVTQWNGTNVSSPATAGIPDVNVKNMNNVSASSVTTVNANQGTTQPENFTGTGASALVKVDAIDWASGAIPAPSVTGVPKTDLAYILGTLLTETAGQIAAGFKKFFNIAAPAATMDHGVLVDTATALGSAYDAAKTAATQASVNAIPTNPLLTTDTRLNDLDAPISGIPTNPLLTDDVRLPAGITPISTLAQSDILSDATPFAGADIALIQTDTGNLVNRLGAFVGSGANTVLGFLQAIMRSDVSAPSGVGGTFDPATDSEQALSAKITALPVPATVAAIVDGVWNELLAGHTTPNSAAQLLISASAASGAPTVNQIVNGILNELLAGHTTPGSVAVAIELINAVYAIVQTIGAGVTFVRSPVSANGDTEVRLGVRYSGVYALHYTSNSSADLLASGITVALNFANQKFLASSVTGAPGAWHIYVGISETQTAVLVLGTYDAQLALYANGVEVPELSNFKMTVAPNP